MSTLVFRLFLEVRNWLWVQQKQPLRYRQKCPIEHGSASSVTFLGHSWLERLTRASCSSIHHHLLYFLLLLPHHLTYVYDFPSWNFQVESGQDRGRIQSDTRGKIIMSVNHSAGGIQAQLWFALRTFRSLKGIVTSVPEKSFFQVRQKGEKESAGSWCDPRRHNWPKKAAGSNKRPKTLWQRELLLEKGARKLLTYWRRREQELSGLSHSFFFLTFPYL